MYLHNGQINQEDESRVDGDVDIVGIVYDLLIKAGRTPQDLEIYLYHPFITAARHYRPLKQIMVMNRYWQFQLLCCEEPSFEQRSNLVMVEDHANWLRLFETNVVPFIQRNGLPTV